MIRRIQMLPRRQRSLIFALFLFAFVLFFLSLVALLFVSSLNATPRSLPVTLLEGVQVHEFATLPDDDAYPYALALGPDGTLYTGSYASGAVWAITPQGAVSELPGTRVRIGSVTGLAVADDGTLYVLDRVEPLAARGALLWTLRPGETPALFARLGDEMDDANAIVPGFMALDGQGRLYISDRGPDVVWRLDDDGQAVLWWRPPGGSVHEPTGLAYDPLHDAMLIADAAANSIYRVPVAAEVPSAATEVVYRHDRDHNLPGFGGLAVAPDGTIYAALLAQNQVARVADGALIYLAQDFRGASDIACDALCSRLYVANWDQLGLLGLGIQPRLPFALDVVELGD